MDGQLGRSVSRLRCSSECLSTHCCNDVYSTTLYLLKELCKRGIFRFDGMVNLWKQSEAEVHPQIQYVSTLDSRFALYESFARVLLKTTAYTVAPGLVSLMDKSHLRTNIL